MDLVLIPMDLPPRAIENGVLKHSRIEKEIFFGFWPAKPSTVDYWTVPVDTDPKKECSWVEDISPSGLPTVPSFFPGENR